MSLRVCGQQSLSSVISFVVKHKPSPLGLEIPLASVEIEIGQLREKCKDKKRFCSRRQSIHHRGRVDLMAHVDRHINQGNGRIRVTPSKCYLSRLLSALYSFWKTAITALEVMTLNGQVKTFQVICIVAKTLRGTLSDDAGTISRRSEGFLTLKRD